MKYRYQYVHYFSLTSADTKNLFNIKHKHDAMMQGDDQTLFTGQNYSETTSGKKDLFDGSMTVLYYVQYICVTWIN